VSYEPKLKRPPVYDRQRSSKKPLSREVTVFLDDEAVVGLTKAHEGLAAAEARREALDIVLARREADGASLERLAETTDALTEAAAEVTQAQEVVQSAYDDLMEHHAATFKLVSIGRKRYDALVLQHPPTEGQNAENQTEFGTNAPYNVDTFPPALLEQVCIDPIMALWEWKALFDWNLLTDEELTLAYDQWVPGQERELAIQILRERQPEWNTSELVELTTAAIEVCTHRRVVSLGKAYG
jgi:hypothetical protein